MKGIFLLVFLSELNILDLPREYAKQGDVKSAIRSYSEIYRTSPDSIVKYQALFEQAQLYLELHDTIMALSNLYRLSQRFLPDSLALKVFSNLFKLDRSRLGDNALRFAYLYPSVSNRKEILSKLLEELKEFNDTISYFEILKILASDYGKDYKKELATFVYKNNKEQMILPELFKVEPKAPYYYYIGRGDTFSAFYALFGRRGKDSRKLRLKILYLLGAYDVCFRMIDLGEKDVELVRMKILSGIKMRLQADSIIKILKFYEKNKGVYRELVSMLDTVRDYWLLKALLKKDPVRALLNAKGSSAGLRDTVFFELAKWLTVKGEYGLARRLIAEVKNYYPLDTLELWKDFLEKKKDMPQDILLDSDDVVGTVKRLFDNGYYAELVQYAKGRELPKRVVRYIAESLYMLWKLYGKRGYLRSALELANKYENLIPRDLYLKIVFDYEPFVFDIERYNYENLTKEELYYLYFILKSQNKVELIKDFSDKKEAIFLYYIAKDNVDSALSYLPEDQKFYLLLFNELDLSREDSVKVFRKLSQTSLDYNRYPSKNILKRIIPIAVVLNDYLASDTLLSIYQKHFGKDKFFAYHRAKFDFILEEYKKSLFYSLFYDDDSFQVLTALSLLKLDRIQDIGNLTLDKHAKTLLYLKTGMLNRVNTEFLDESDAMVYIKEIMKKNLEPSGFFSVLDSLLNKGKIDSMTYVAYGIYLGFLNPDSVYLSTYGKSLLKYLKVKDFMRKNLLDSVLLIIGNPEDAVDSFKYHLYFKKGTVLYLKKQYKEAYQNYMKAANFDNLKDAALYNAYLSVKRANMRERVIKTLKEYIKECNQCEKLPDAYISLGFNYVEIGKPDSAIKILKSVEGYLNSGQEAEVKYWLGTAYMQDSMFDISAGYFLRIYKYHQKNGQWGDTGGLNGARLCYVLGLKEKAKNIYRAIIRKRKDDAIANEAKKELSILK